MKNQIKTHWKRLANKDYIGAYELMTGDEPIDLDVQIVSVEKKTVVGPNNRQDECIVANLKGQKPLILNATNAKTIEKLAASPFIEDWAGLRITLYVAQVRAFGETVDALRIRETKPKLPEFTPNHKKWDAAKEAIKNGSTDIGSIKKEYTLSSVNEELLTE